MCYAIVTVSEDGEDRVIHPECHSQTSSTPVGLIRLKRLRLEF